jgi:hypothetical protein
VNEPREGEPHNCPDCGQPLDQSYIDAGFSDHGGGGA